MPAMRPTGPRLSSTTAGLRRLAILDRSATKCAQSAPSAATRAIAWLLACGMIIPHKGRAKRSLHAETKAEAMRTNRIFFDELVGVVAASRLKVTGAIMLEDAAGWHPRLLAIDRSSSVCRPYGF